MFADTLAGDEAEGEPLRSHDLSVTGLRTIRRCCADAGFSGAVPLPGRRSAAAMTILVKLTHETRYVYDRPVRLGPQTIRLRPAPHARTPIASYSLTVDPGTHFCNWQQDPHGNFLARLVFPQPTRELRIAVDLTAEMSVINPFDFFLEEAAEQFPFSCAPELNEDLKPYLRDVSTEPRFLDYRRTIDVTPRKTMDFLVDLNRKLQSEISYVIRMEPGVQGVDETLAAGRGSCRDSAWLMVQLLRSFGLAARFVSGYLIQLAPDQKPIDGPAGPEADFTDLHAWAEVYLPGAGWVGMDPTSGLLAGEGHIPLAATPSPATAAPLSGGVERSGVEFSFQMNLVRIHEDPRVTRPYSDSEWEAIDRLGAACDRRLNAGDVRLTMGGEPTFVSIDDMEGAEWTTAATGRQKQQRSLELLRRLSQRFGSGGLRHYGQGKWYPGEPLPRWAYTCLWRTDGQPLWSNPDLLTEPGDAPESPDLPEMLRTAESFVRTLAGELSVSPQCVTPAWEDVFHLLELEQRLPPDVNPDDYDADDPEERRRLARALGRGVSRPAGYVLPLSRAWWQADARWLSAPWRLRAEKLYLIPGDSPMGLRLPLQSLSADDEDAGLMRVQDTFDVRRPLPGYAELRSAARDLIPPAENSDVTITVQQPAAVQQSAMREESPGGPAAATPSAQSAGTHGTLVRTAVCVEPRQGRLHVFMPPLGALEDYLELLACVEKTAERLGRPVVVEGYLPPTDPRIRMLKVTPDPGVIEVNVQPAGSWQELKEVVTGVYDDARACRLGTEKFQLDGRHSGTGGGNHLVVGGPTPADSPFLRRPDVLRSLIGFWNNHPSLSYLFSGLFIGPTSQSPRVDEGRADALSELEIAFRQLPEPGADVRPWIVDRIFRNLLIDLTGNTHRAEICIDKLYSPDHSAGRLGLVELRAFEMPPHSRMSLAQQLLVRALIVAFWERPYRDPLIHWGTAIHDRFMMPFHLWNDLVQVTEYLRQTDLPLQPDWYRPHLEFRCPPVGSVKVSDVQLELRQALEPWYVLGEEPGSGGTTRFVDSSLERLQVLVRGLFDPQLCVTVNGVRLPLQPTQTPGEFVAAVRYRAWQPPRCLQPTIGVQTPLVFDLVDQSRQISLGGCRCHADHPGGLNPAAFPLNALEAESRRAARFFRSGHTPGRIVPQAPRMAARFPCTLDLRQGIL